MNFVVSSYQIGSAFYDIEILIALPHRKRCVRSREFMAEDLGEEDVVGLVSGFEAVAADGSVGAAEVAGFQGWSREPKAAETYLGSCGG
jgi:hypothetical protein